MVRNNRVTNINYLYGLRQTSRNESANGALSFPFPRPFPSPLSHAGTRKGTRFGTDPRLIARARARAKTIRIFALLIPYADSPMSISLPINSMLVRCIADVLAARIGANPRFQQQLESSSKYAPPGGGGRGGARAGGGPRFPGLTAENYLTLALPAVSLALRVVHVK